MVTILHLEDDLILLDIFKTAIKEQESDINLIQCLRGVQVLEQAQSNDANIDLYILDIRVRGRMNGIEVAQKLRDSGVTTPIILSSAYEKPPKQLLDTLDCLWIPKPWTLDLFLEDVVRIATNREEQAKIEQNLPKTILAIDLYDLVKTCISHARKAAEAKQIRLRLAYRQGDDLRVHGNYEELYHAFSELIDNGIRYGNDNGNLIVKLFQSDDKVMASIEDDGIGIAPEYHKKIFERFFYIDDDDDNEQKTKLTRGEGLYTVQQIIDTYGGSISVRSELHKGTKFLVTLA
ncbi:MAG: ATP-binding protein [Chloroflexota bacterium]